MTIGWPSASVNQGERAGSNGLRSTCMLCAGMKPWASSFSFQATLGLTMPLADFHYDVADVGDTVHAGEILPQGRVGFGWWF